MKCLGQGLQLMVCELCSAGEQPGVRCVCCGQVALLGPHALGSAMGRYPGQEVGPIFVLILRHLCGGVTEKPWQVSLFLERESWLRAGVTCALLLVLRSPQVEGQ